jgi:hypothetical protein
MRRFKVINDIRSALKRFTLGLAVSALVVLGSGLSANAAITYDFSTGLQGWTQIYPTTGDLWAADFGWPAATGSLGHLGAGWEAAETQMGRSPEFKLNGTGDLTFQTHGSKSPLAAVDVTPSTVPEFAIEGGGFCGLALRDVATDTYVLSRGQSVDLYDVFTTLSFTTAELAPFANNGKMYTLDWIDYDKLGGGGWGWLVNVSIPGVLPASTACDITAFGPGAIIDQNANTIAWYVPSGTTPAQVAALAPTPTRCPLAPRAISQTAPFLPLR